jgi:hypothetical protein
MVTPAVKREAVAHLKELAEERRRYGSKGTRIGVA